VTTTVDPRRPVARPGLEIAAATTADGDHVIL
jgi:hypothetical protein